MISVSSGLQTGRLREKWFVNDSALGPAVKGDLTGPMPSWCEYMFLCGVESGVFWIGVERGEMDGLIWSG